LRNSTADDLGFEDEIFAVRVRFEDDLDARELAGTTGLLLVRVVFFGLARDRFAIGNLRRTDIGLDLELATHAVDEDVEVEFAHAGNDGLAGFLVGLDAEGRVFGRQAVERETHLFLVALGLRLDGDLDDRLGEFHAFEDDGLRRIAERIAGRRFLEAWDSNDVAGERVFDVLTGIGMHLQHAADAPALILDRVENGRALFQLAGTDAGEGQRTDE